MFNYQIFRNEAFGKFNTFTSHNSCFEYVKVYVKGTKYVLIKAQL